MKNKLFWTVIAIVALVGFFFLSELWDAFQRRGQNQFMLQLSRGENFEAEETFKFYFLDPNKVVGQVNMTDFPVVVSGGLPLYYFVVWLGNDRLLQLMFEKGAEIKLTSPSGTNALHYAQSVERASFLIDQGIDLNAQEVNGGKKTFTKLMMAVNEGDFKLVELLLNHGADSNVKMYNGIDAEEIARQRGHTNILELIEFSNLGNSDSQLEED